MRIPGKYTFIKKLAYRLPLILHAWVVYNNYNAICYIILLVEYLLIA